MSWSYDPTLQTDRDLVRFWVGDTNADDPQIWNEEIDALLAATTSVEAAAVDAARAILARYARAVDKSVGDLKISYGQRRDAYRALLAELERRLALKAALPAAGGISKARKAAVEADGDRVAPAFKRNQFDA
jgi:hypothetical protein